MIKQQHVKLSMLLFPHSNSLAPNADEATGRTSKTAEGPSPLDASAPAAAKEKETNEADRQEGTWRRAKVVCDYDAMNRDEMSLMMNEVSRRSFLHLRNSFL